MTKAASGDYINMYSCFNGLTRNLYIVLMVALCLTPSCTKIPEAESNVTHAQRIEQRIEQLANECCEEYPDVQRITVNEFPIQNEASQNKQVKWIIVDVRSQRERDVSIIHGSLSVDEFEAQWDLFKGSPILVYCTAGCRSGAYTRKLKQKGFKAFNLRGGVLAWALEGLTFVTPNEEVTNRVHVYGKKWDALPPGYEAVIGQ
ncbi:MAG: rhodanese-like domain-containing protein [Candidatus Anammoxibacter sp.]